MIEIKDAYYFSHDSNAKDDPKCVMLIEQMGLEGYGIFWVLVETLRDQPNYQYPLALVPALSRRYNTTAAKMRTIIDKYGLFSITEDDQFFFSHSLNRRMKKREELSEKQRLRVMKRWHPDDTAVLPEEYHGNTERYQERKGKEKKGNEIKNIPPISPKGKSVCDLLSHYSEPFRSAFDAYAEMRKKKKKPLTYHAAELTLKKLMGFSNDENIQIMILEQSTMNCWTGVFELKSGQTSQPEVPDFSDPNSYQDQREEDLPEWAKASNSQN